MGSTFRPIMMGSVIEGRPNEPSMMSVEFRGSVGNLLSYRCDRQIWKPKAVLVGRRKRQSS